MMICFWYHKAFKVLISNVVYSSDTIIFCYRNRVPAFIWYVLWELLLISMEGNGNILYDWPANIIVVNNILIFPVNQNKWKTSDAKIWSEF